MRPINAFQSVAFVALALILSRSPSVQAHLMVAQHGTLNVVDDGVFMVVSLPISAFEGIDDDKDGKVSMIEFNNHRGVIIEAIRQNVILSDAQNNVSLQGVMLSPVVAHDSKGESLSQLTVIGRFAPIDSASALRFHIGLYGRQAAEQSLEITAIRNHDNQRTVFELTPASPASWIFPDDA